MSMWQLFVEFWRLDDPNVAWVLAGAMLLGGTAGVVGSFAFLRKRALVGDALAHAALPGVTMAFFLVQSRELEVLLAGAVISCLLGMFAIDYLVNHTRIKPDSALAIVLSVFFAAGIFQLTHIQQMPLGNQAGLDKLLFGQAAALVRDDVIVLGTVAIISLVLVVALLDRLRLVIFDRQYARAIGLNVRLYDAILAILLVLAVAIGLQLAGVVLMAAVLLTPMAAARYWSDRLGTLLILAGLFGVLAGIAGANISYLAPRMPTGPWMVVAISTLFFVSLVFAPGRGLLSRWLRRRQMERKVVDENILRTLYKAGEVAGEARLTVEPQTILKYRNMQLATLERGLRRLQTAGQIERLDHGWRLTARGEQRAQNLTRRHRLWELYLSRQFKLPADHLHDDAEAVEHLLDTDMERRLLDELGGPAIDPHGRDIPGVTSKAEN